MRVSIIIKSSITNRYYTDNWRNRWDSNIENAKRFDHTGEIHKEFKRDEDQASNDTEEKPYVIINIIE